MSPQAPVVRATGAGRRFGGHEALRDVDLTVHAGERVGILGASGAGKSTLLGLLNGSVAATSGTVEVFDDDPAALPPARLRALQRRIGTVPQRLDLIEQVRVLHNVNAGRLGAWSAARSLWSLVASRPDGDVRDALEQVGLAWAVHERTELLSGGERQRVAIARLLVQRPELVLADEPVSSLDPTRADEVLRLLRGPAQGATLVLSLHQPELARRHCTRVVGLRHGQVVFDGDPHGIDDTDLASLYALA